MDILRIVYYIHGYYSDEINVCCFSSVTLVWALHDVIKRQFLHLYKMLPTYRHRRLTLKYHRTSDPPVWQCTCMTCSILTPSIDYLIQYHKFNSLLDIIVALLLCHANLIRSSGSGSAFVLNNNVNILTAYEAPHNVCMKWVSCWGHFICAGNV